MDDRTELFINKYKQIEKIISSEYDLGKNDSAIGFLLRRPEYRSIRIELDYCREVRNLLSHYPKLDERYAVVPSEEMIALLDRILEKINHQKRAKDILIPRENIFSCSIDDLVYPAMVRMRDCIFTHIPILKDEVVTGVFSENTILCYLIDEEIVNIDSNMHFSDVEKYLPIDKHESESFRFISPNTLLADVEAIFAEGVGEKDRIGLVFVTNNGKPTGKLIGLISAWDMAGVDII